MRIGRGQNREVRLARKYIVVIWARDDSRCERAPGMERMIGLKRHFLEVGRDHVGFISASKTTPSSISCCIMPELFSLVTRPC